MQTAEQNLEIWYTHSAWTSIMQTRCRNREDAKKGAHYARFTGDKRNITTREEGAYVVVRMWGFVPNPDRSSDVVSLPWAWRMLCEKMIDLRTNETFLDRGRMNNAV